MRKRDLAILLLSAFAIFFSLQKKGNFSFKEAWFHPLDDSNPFKHEAERLPPPLVTDLNGDGRKEVLVATYDAEIHVIEPYHKSIDDGFSESRVLAKVSLLPEKVRVAAGRLPVAMAAGTIQRAYKPSDVSKQVLVVVTAGWNVICYDHNLKKLWEEDLSDHFPTQARHKEVAILISNYTLRHGDSGLVIVGGSVEVQPNLFLDPFEEELLAQKEAERHRQSAEDSKANEVRGSGTGRNIHYYAFAGKTGTLRWSHESQDFEKHANEAELIPQHNYKLDANSMNSRHKGEVECREYRESILDSMPHRWDRREDTKFELHHFRKHKRKVHKRLPGSKSSSILQKPDGVQKPGKDAGNKLANVLGKAAELASNTKPMKRSLYLPTITNQTNLWWVPNVFVAHLKEGIEAIHLASGRTVCKLHLGVGGLHADVNGDGVLDHVQAVGGVGAERVVPTGLMEAIKPCTAVVTSGVPVREQIFNASICRHYPFGGFQMNDHAKRGNSFSLEVVTPVLFPTFDGHRHRKGSHGDLIFLTNRGEVTSYTIGPHGQDASLRWQIVTPVSWSNSPFQTGLGIETVVPTLSVMPLRVYGLPEVILVAGEQEAVLISPTGQQLNNLYLPFAPTHALVIADFSGDGFNDLILVSSVGIHGFVQTQQPGAILFSSLAAFLIIVMCIIFITQHFSISDAKKKVPGR